MLLLFGVTYTGEEESEGDEDEDGGMTPTKLDVANSSILVLVAASRKRRTEKLCLYARELGKKAGA